MSSGFLALSSGITYPLKRRLLAAHLGVSNCIYGIAKGKWKMRKEARHDLVLCHCGIVVYLCVFVSIQSIVHRIIRHPHGPVEFKQ